MRKIITFFSLILLASGLLAQVPGKLSFQAVVRNAEGEPLKSSNVGIRIQLLQSSEFGAAIYVETHESTTNENGVVTLEIGAGTVVTGNLDTVDWKKGPYFLKTEIDPSGGMNYTITGTSQLLSVPYALYAKTTSLPSGLVNLTANPNAGDLLFFDGTGWKALPKGNNGQVLTMVDGMPEWKDVSTGNELSELHDPVLEIVFKDRTGNHNMGIASDGKYYYTCNGGNYSIGRINKYTLAGDSITSYPMAIDMRSIMYNKDDGKFYVSGFESNTSERNIYKITSLQDGTFTKVLPNLYDNIQSSVALSDDGRYLYAFNAGTLKQYKLSDGSPTDTINGLNSGTASGSDKAVAVDPNYLYTWDPATGEVYAYDHSGAYKKSITLSNGNYGFSLSVANGYLFVAKDSNYGTGIWYGYNIRRKLSETPVPDLKMPVNEVKSMQDADDSTK
jgi:hypothetical protein